MFVFVSVFSLFTSIGHTECTGTPRPLDQAPPLARSKQYTTPRPTTVSARSKIETRCGQAESCLFLVSPQTNFQLKQGHLISTVCSMKQ